MKTSVCLSCSSPKTLLSCGICELPVCKSCAVYLEENYFSFMKTVPRDLSHITYCHGCFEAKVANALISYDDVMERARNIEIFTKSQGRETRLMKRAVRPVEALNCPDKQETILRLAFLAAEAGYNGLIDVELKSKKIIVNSYQSTLWNGRGVPIQLKRRS